MLDIFSKNLVGFIAEMPLSANLFRVGSSTQNGAGSRGAAPVGARGDEAPVHRKKN